MKILHVFHYSNLVNGVDRTTLTLLSALKKQGQEVFAWVPKSGDVTIALDAIKIPYRISDLGCCTGPNKMAELNFLGRAAKRALEIEDWIRHEKFDLVHINTGHLVDAAIAAARTDTPAIWHIHSPFDEDLKRYNRFMAEDGYAWLLGELGSHVIAVSNDVRNSLLPWIPEKKISTLHNGVDVEDLDSRSKHFTQPLRDELDLPPGAPLVLGIGRISAQKDFATFVRVANRVIESHPSVCFAIAGPEENKELGNELRQLIGGFDLSRRVFLLGPRIDTPALLAQSDVFLSTAVFEGHPLTSLEAMSLKKPVVAMNCVGLRECIQNGTDGLLVSLGDEEACAKEVMRVLTDKTLSSQLGKHARQSVTEHYSAVVYANGFLDIAERAIVSNAPSPKNQAASFALGLLEKIHEAHQQIMESKHTSQNDRFSFLRNSLRQIIKKLTP